MESVVSGRVSFSGRDMILVKFLKDAKKAGKTRLEVVAELNAGKAGFIPKKPLDAGKLNGLAKGIINKVNLALNGGKISRSETDGKTVNTIITEYKAETDPDTIKLGNLMAGVCSAFYVRGQRGRKGISMSGLAAMLRDALTEDEDEEKEEEALDSSDV